MSSLRELDQTIVDYVSDRTGKDIVLLCEALDLLRVQEATIRSQHKTLRMAFMALGYNADKTNVMDVLAEGLTYAQPSASKSS